MKASEIAKQAFREGNIVPLDATTGEAITTPGQDIEALALLNRFLTSLLGFEIGDYEYDWTVPPAVTSPIPARVPLFPQHRDLPADVWPYPPPNSRIVLNLTANTTIYFQQDPADGARMTFADAGGSGLFALTIQGNGRLVEGAKSLAESAVNLNGRVLMYRADLADWVRITTLTADDDSPLPDIYDDLLSIGTAIRLAPRYGRPISVETAETFKRLLKRAKSQFRQPRAGRSSVPAAFTRPATSHDVGRRGSNFR